MSKRPKQWQRQIPNYGNREKKVLVDPPVTIVPGEGKLALGFEALNFQRLRHEFMSNRVSSEYNAKALAQPKTVIVWDGHQAVEWQVSGTTNLGVIHVEGSPDGKKWYGLELISRDVAKYRTNKRREAATLDCIRRIVARFSCDGGVHQLRKESP